MFPNVEYHKFKKKNAFQTIAEKTKEVLSKEEPLQQRFHTNAWDPKLLLEELYQINFLTRKPHKHVKYLNKSGYLEKLPSGRKTATYWNPWKRKFVQLKDGFLYCYDTHRDETPCMTITLMGGHIETLENGMIGVDDRKGHFLVFRSPNENELEEWLQALRSQCTEDFLSTYTKPSLHPVSTHKKVIVIDLGSCSTRAGVLMSTPSLPQLFFPTVCATHRQSKKNIFGIQALSPSVRRDSYLVFPLQQSSKVTKYTIDMSLLPDLLKHIFQNLNVNPKEYNVQLSMPRTISFETKLKIASIFLDDFKVKGLNVTHQAILSLHAYNTKSGVIVDIGERLDILPIVEGYIVESGVARLPYGGKRMLHHLQHSLAEKNMCLSSPVESYLARYLMEELCYVAEDYNDEMERYHVQKDDFHRIVPTEQFFNEQTPWDQIPLDMARFNVSEGLFSPEMWGLDHKGLHKLIHHAIQECGIDLRKEMIKNVYISGGLTLMLGFVERLELELNRLTACNTTSKVHASPYRYHMAYIGACQIALEDNFKDLCISKKQLTREGNTCVKKWHT